MKFVRPFSIVDANGMELRPPDFVKITKYRPEDTEPDVQLRGNQMAMAFPPLLSDRELFKDLFKPVPARPEGFRDLPIEQRQEHLLRINTSFHYVFPSDLSLVRRTLGIVRTTLRSRDPREPKVKRAILSVLDGRNAQVPRMETSGGGGGLGLLIAGLSGVGKTSLVDRIAHHLGNFGRFHPHLDGEPAQWPQLGIVRVNVGETWALTQEKILGECNRQHGSDVNPRKARTRGQLDMDVPGALSRGLAPILLVDEVQKLNMKAESSETKRIIRGLNDLMTEYGIPVGLIGAMSVRKLLLEFPHEMSRYTTGGDITLDRLTTFDADTNNFINELLKHAVSKDRPKVSDSFNKDLWAHCMGLRRYMVEYARVALAIQAEDERTCLNKDLLRAIALKDLQCFEPTLSFLRKVDLGMTLSYQDCQTYENYFDASIEQLSSEARIRVDAKWRIANPNTKQGRGATLDAEGYESLQEELAREEAADAARNKDSKTQASATKKGSSPGRGKSVKPSPMKQVKAKLKKVSGVIPLGGSGRGRKDERDTGVDAEDIR